MCVVDMAAYMRLLDVKEKVEHLGARLPSIACPQFPQPSHMEFSSPKTCRHIKSAKPTRRHAEKPKSSKLFLHATAPHSTFLLPIYACEQNSTAPSYLAHPHCSRDLSQLAQVQQDEAAADAVDVPPAEFAEEGGQTHRLIPHIM